MYQCQCRRLSNVKPHDSIMAIRIKHGCEQMVHYIWPRIGCVAAFLACNLKSRKLKVVERNDSDVWTESVPNTLYTEVNWISVFSPSPNKECFISVNPWKVRVRASERTSLNDPASNNHPANGGPCVYKYSAPLRLPHEKTTYIIIHST